MAGPVWRIPTAPFDSVNSFAIVGEAGDVTLVDCGVKKAPARIVAGLAAIGKAPQDVTRIVLTHVHPDHAGGARRMSKLTGRPVDVHAGDAEHGRNGTVPPSDPSTRLGRLFNRRVGVAYAPFEVGQELADGQVLEAAGGLRVVHTPGHSPGHVSLLHEPTGVLVTGDAIFNVFGLRWPLRPLCNDVRLTQRTADVLGELEYDVAAFTHGPHVDTDARETVRRFLRDARRD